LPCRATGMMSATSARRRAFSELERGSRCVQQTSRRQYAKPAAPGRRLKGRRRPRRMARFARRCDGMPRLKARLGGQIRRRVFEVGGSTARRCLSTETRAEPERPSAREMCATSRRVMEMDKRWRAMVDRLVISTRSPRRPPGQWWRYAPRAWDDAGGRGGMAAGSLGAWSGGAARYAWHRVGGGCAAAHGRRTSLVRVAEFAYCTRTGCRCRVVGIGSQPAGHPAEG